MKSLSILLVILFALSGCEKEEVSSSATNPVYEKIGKKSIVLEVGASNCVACINMKKLIDELKKEDPNIPIHLVDVYEDKDSASKFQIRMIPTQIVLDGKGDEIYRHIGGLSREELLNLVEMTKEKKI